MEASKKCDKFDDAVTQYELTNCERFEGSNEETNSQEYSCSMAAQMPYDESAVYQSNLFSYEDSEYYHNYHFGLIRGYHREMYDENTRENWFLCCQPLDRETVNRMKRRNRVLSCQVLGILFGAFFVFVGISSLVVSFLVSSDETKEYFWHSLDVPTMYIHIIAIVGLTVLTLGSALISFCLLVPVCIRRIHGRNIPGFWCTTGDLYVKNVEQMSPNQFLYFDAALCRNFVGKAKVKKIQPEHTNLKD